MLFPGIDREVAVHAAIQGSPPPARTWLIDSCSSGLHVVNSIKGCGVRTS
jgi:hypothetical protein